ncbi:uncharacterized protein LOC143242372 [Tachypleus tridentatus]|uniref:uncharacterized protein LOC143242372 n=1 Tax=Tachypleus tridentatus TaxID=6853 RepID=UPI003FCF940B
MAVFTSVYVVEVIIIAVPYVELKYNNISKSEVWWKCSFCRRRQGQDRLGLEPPPGSGMQRVPSVRRMTQRMGQLRREESVLVPELSVDLEEKIDLEGGPPRSLKKGQSGKIVGESERSFSLEGHHSIGIKPNDKNREKNHVIHLRTCHDSRSPVDRQKSLESSSKIRKSSTPERSVSSHEDEHLSLDAASERRYSFEYRRNPTGQGLYSNTYSGNPHQHRNNFHYSSVSLDECVHDDLEIKQKQVRITKRSRFQRQKYCIEEPDSGPTINRPGIQTQRDVKPTLTSRRIFGGSVEAINKCTSYVTDYSNETPTSTGVSSVPGQQNSDSSHPDGIGAKLSPLNNREPEDYDPYYAFERLTERKTTKKIQKSRRHTIDLDKNYEVNPTRTPNSSSDEYVYVNKPHSLDDHEVYSYSTLRRSIPSVFVHTVPDIDPPSQPYLQSKDPPRRNSTGRALPHVPAPDNLLGLHSFPSECNFTIHSLDLPRDEKGRTERRASAPERDNIELVTADVNCESQHVFPQKKVLLNRDQRDTEAGSRGFGMSLTGGKSTDSARKYPTVAWTRPGGLADLKGIYKGDRILEWGGVTLVDRTFEEVSDIIERTGDNVEVVIEQDNGKANENQSRSPHSSHHTVTWSSISPRSPTLSLLPGTGTPRQTKRHLSL